MRPGTAAGTNRTGRAGPPRDAGAGGEGPLLGTRWELSGVPPHPEAALGVPGSRSEGSPCPEGWESSECPGTRRVLMGGKRSRTPHLGGLCLVSPPGNRRARGSGTTAPVPEPLGEQRAQLRSAYPTPPPRPVPARRPPPARAPRSQPRPHSPSPERCPRGSPARLELRCLRRQEGRKRPPETSPGGVGEGRCAVPCPLPSAGAGPSAALTRSCRGGAPSFIPHRPGWSLAGAGTGLAPAPASASAGPAGDAAAPAPGWGPGPGAPPPPPRVLLPGSRLGVHLLPVSAPPGGLGPLPVSRLCPLRGSRSRLCPRCSQALGAAHGAAASRGRAGQGGPAPAGGGEGTVRTLLPVPVPRHRGQSQPVRREPMG